MGVVAPGGKKKVSAMATRRLGFVEPFGME